MTTRRMLVGFGSIIMMLASCNGSQTGTSSQIDTRLQVHAIAPAGEATPEKLAYAEAIADVHARADRLPASDAAAILQAGLEIPVPQRFEQATALRLELATRLAEIWHHELGKPLLARELLMPLLAPEVSLPLDPAAARALVALGDAAAARGDDALAAGCYARALRVLSMLREELE